MLLSSLCVVVVLLRDYTFVNIHRIYNFDCIDKHLTTPDPHIRHLESHLYAE